MIEIKFDSDLPIYEQLRREIIIGIAKGEIQRGQRLPSVRQLGEDLGINLHTVRKAYNQLKEEGYLKIDRRIGAVVSQDFDQGMEDFKAQAFEDLAFFMADAKNRGLAQDQVLGICQEFYSKYEEG